MAKSRITTVLFDLDGTLRHSDPNGFETFVGFLAELGHPLPTERVMDGHRWVHYYWSISPELLADIRELGDDTPEFWLRHTERQLRAVGIDGELPDLTSQMGQLFLERYRPVHLVPAEVIPTLMRLRELGYTVGLVSNRRAHWRRCAPSSAWTANFGLRFRPGKLLRSSPTRGFFFKRLLWRAVCPKRPSM